MRTTYINIHLYEGILSLYRLQTLGRDMTSSYKLIPQDKKSAIDIVVMARAL